MQVIEIQSHKELPTGVEMLLYERPFYGASEGVQGAISEFAAKYDYEPQTVYQVPFMSDYQYYVVKEE